MRNQLFFWCLFLFLFILNGYTQDTVRVMHYNLLYYGVNNSFCNTSNNNLLVKNDALRTIISHAQPDIFTVNEISSNASFHQMILDSVFNINGVTKYKHGNVTNYSGRSIVNGIFYDSEKFEIASQYALVGGDRDINVYRLYYKSPELAWSNDTVFITFFVAHLSSGSGSQNEQNRDNEVGIVMNHLATLSHPGNYIFQGDFNVYSSSEAAFQRMINNPNQELRFYDPVNKIGAWAGNPTYTLYHTQSTHTTTDCHIGGGMDDRFDFIMINMPVIMETLGVKYVPNSYTTLGQDGQRLNKSLIDIPVNTSAPTQVIQALYDMSDHLPVLLDFKINQTPVGMEQTLSPQVYINVINPVDEQLDVNIFALNEQEINLNIFDVSGRLVIQHSQVLTQNNNRISIHCSHLPKGLYILQINNQFTHLSSFRIVKL
jgi:hypothetical protein